MECIVPGNNMKVLAKSLQALSKIGDELFIEAKDDKFSLITLNLNKTVCAQFHFFDSFFSSFEVNQDDLKAASNQTISCKVHMKVFLPLFKGNLEKKLDYFKLEYSTGSDFIIFKMKYKCDEIIMVHKLCLMDTETLTIGVLSDSGSNRVSASSSFYNQLLATFNVSDDEITFEINEAKVVARNYCVGTPCRPKMMRTQINLNSSEFLSYQIAKNTSINFSLKPFRTVVQFADNFNLNVDFNFEIGGKPLSMILKNPTFEVNFIVATLDPYSETTSTIATTTVEKQVARNKDSEVSVDDFEAMEAENWENNDMSSKESTFVELMKNGNKSPESPRTKKAKTVFGRCYDPTFHETILGQVLAENSDDSD